MGQPRRSAGGTRPARFRGPFGGGGSRALGGPGGREVSLDGGRCHGNHFRGRSGRGLRRCRGRRAAVATAQAAVATAKSQQTQTQAQLAAVQAGQKQADADLLAAQAKQQRADAFWKRIAALVPEHAASQDTLEEAVAAQRVAAADVSVVRERITAQGAAVRQAEAAVAAAQSGVRQAESVVAGQQAALGRAEAQRAAANSAPKQVRRAGRKPTRQRPKWPAPRPRSSRPA